MVHFAKLIFTLALFAASSVDARRLHHTSVRGLDAKGSKSPKGGRQLDGSGSTKSPKGTKSPSSSSSSSSSAPKRRHHARALDSKSDASSAPKSTKGPKSLGRE